MRKLVILSHTEHYIRNGETVGWGPTVREINELCADFEEIVHIACLHPGKAPESCIAYEGTGLRFIPVPPYGGETMMQKLSIFRVFPRILRLLRKERNNADWTQVRLPTGIGVLLLPWLWLTGKTGKLWIKYAGNWNQEHAPAGYRFQKWFLENNLLQVPVTINGKWPGQRLHLISFENPCLTDEQIRAGVTAMQKKAYRPPFQFTFTGKLFESKGLMNMLLALAALDPAYIKNIHIIGEGDDRQKAEEFCLEHRLPAIFHGFLPINEVHKLLEETHFVVLPSRSEGFPKVLAEGAAYGAIPVASAVSAIPHYFTDGKSGFLWWRTNESFISRFTRIPFDDTGLLEAMAAEAQKVSQEFTFSAYRKKLSEKIFTRKP